MTNNRQYRTLHPKQQNTHSSQVSAQGTFSRTDHLLGGQTRLNNFKNTEIIENIFCDHSGVKSITQRKLENYMSKN